MDTEYLKRVGIYILVAVLSIGIVFYAGYHLYHTFTREVETVPARVTELNRTVKSQSYIFRTETVLTSASAGGGSVVPSVTDGENVKKQGTVAEIFSVNAPATVAKIQEIDSRISLLNSVADTSTISLKGTAQSENDIYNILSDLRDMAGNGDASASTSYRTNLITLLNKRNILIRGNSLDITAEINAMQDERVKLRSSLGSLLDTINTPISGYFYSETDGYEDVFSSSSLKDITYTNLLPLLNSTPSYSPNAIGKIVTTPEWYLVCLLDVSYKNTYSEGDTCSLKIGETSINMEIDRALTDPSGIALILKTSTMPAGFSFNRTDEAELVVETYTGISVPSSAVRIVDGQTGVYVLDAATIHFRAVDIIYRGENEYLVSDHSKDVEETTEDEAEETSENKIPWLSINDAIITEGKGLYDGRVIGK